MDRNRRFGKNAFEEHINQFFSGQRDVSRGNADNLSGGTRRVSGNAHHNTDNKYGRSVYNNNYGGNSRNYEEQSDYRRRGESRFETSNESYGKRNAHDFDEPLYERRKVSKNGANYDSRSNDDCSPNSSHRRNYGRSGNDDNFRNNNFDSNSRNRDSSGGYYESWNNTNQDRSCDAIAVNRSNNYREDKSDRNNYDINYGRRNDRGPANNYDYNNFDSFSSSNINNTTAAGTNRFSSNASNDYASRNDFSNEFVNNDRFRSDCGSGNSFDVPRSNYHTESNYNSGNTYLGDQQGPHTNMSNKRPFQSQEGGYSSKSARIVKPGPSSNHSSNNVSATMPSKTANDPKQRAKSEKQKKKDIKQSARRINASIRKKNEKKMIEASGGIQKPKKGLSKVDPEKYWREWWPKYAYIENSIQKFDDEDMKSIEPLIKFVHKPEDSKFVDRKRILLRQGVNKIGRNINITEFNYKARDVVKLFMYRKQLEDPNFQQYLEDGELLLVTNTLNSAKGKVKLALWLQSMIYKWHDYTEIVERKKRGENIPGRHAENSLNDKLFNYLVSDCIQELKELCSKEWPGFDEFYNSL